MGQSEAMQLALWAISAYVFVLFAGWWVSVGSESTLFKITCFMFLGLTVSHFGAWYMYRLAADGHDPMRLLSWSGWHVKGYFVLIPIICYAVHITRRILSNNKYDRRKDDK